VLLAQRGATRAEIRHDGIPHLRVAFVDPFYSSLSHQSEAASRLGRTPRRNAGGRENPDAFADPTWISGNKGLLQKLKPRNSERILWDAGHQIAPGGDYVANLFVFNSPFPVLREESGGKVGPLE